MCAFLFNYKCQIYITGNYFARLLELSKPCSLSDSFWAQSIILCCKEVAGLFNM